MAKKSKKRPHRNNKHRGQANKAKQVQLLQKQQQQESPPAAATTEAGCNNDAKLNSSRALASASANSGSTAEGGTTAVGGHAPTGSGPPAYPWNPKVDLPTRGLVNLGNTCFFNSALQNLFKARLLHEALFGDHSGRREGEYVGPLTKAFRKVLLEMTGHGPVGGRRGAYSPKALLTAVQRVHPSFRGYHQHDAHELFMQLVGTLEDEEVSCIKRRRQEAKEAEAARDNGGGKNAGDRKDISRARSASGSGSGGGSGGREASRSDADAGSEGPGTPTSQSPKLARKPSTGESENADTVASEMTEGSAGSSTGGKESGAVATPGAEKTKTVAMGPESAEEVGTPGSPPLPEGSSATFKVKGGKRSGDDDQESVDDRAAVTTGPGAPTNLLGASGEAESPTSNEETCMRNGDANGQTLDVKRSDGGVGLTPSAGAESVETTGADAKSEEVVLLEANHVPVECLSANAGGMDNNESLQCGGGEDATADGETSTDDGKTTDASDQDDDDDDDGGGGDAMSDTVASSPPRSPDDSPASPAEKEVVTAAETEKEETAERHDAPQLETAVPVAAAIPQRAAATEVFGGMMCSVVTCNSCGGRSFCTEPTICLSLEIPMKHKAISEKAQAFIAKKRAAAAAAKAAAKAAAAEEGSDKAESDSAAVASGTTEHQTPSVRSGDKVDESETIEPALGDENAADDLEGFELSAKEKRKVARQERERRRLMEAEEEVDENAGGDAAVAPGQQSESSDKDTATLSTEGRQDAPQTPQDEGDEVWQCLEHILSVCVSSAGAGGENGDETGVDYGVVAENRATSTSESGLGERQQDVKEHKEVDTQLSIGAEAGVATEGGGKATPGRTLDEEVETDEREGEGRSITKQSAPCTDAVVEPKAATAAGEANVQMALRQSKEKPSAEGGPDTVLARSETCGGGNAGGSRGSGDETTAPNASVTPDPAPVGTGTFTDSNDKDWDDDGRTPRSTIRAEGASEEIDCKGRSCGGDPTLECDCTGSTVRGQDGKAAAAGETVAENASDGQKQQAAESGLRNSIEGETDRDDSQTFSSSSSLTGCTTGETDLREGLASAFGSECSDGNGNNEDNSQGISTSTDSAFKCLGSSGLSEGHVKGEACGKPDSLSPCVQESGRTAESDGACAERGQKSRSSDGSVVATDEDGDDVQRESRATSTGEERRGPAAKVAATKDDCGTGAPSTASQSPLDRLQEPLARVKPDRRHDPDGIDLYGCLDHFMAEEKLVAEDGNGYDCERCSSRPHPPEVEKGDGGGARAKGAAPKRQQNAHKRLLMLGQPPGVLVCHLKRLQAKRKIIRSVEFPIELDMAPYFWRDPSAPLSPSQTCYRLTGLIQHRGSRLGGHYVAYVRDKEGWKHASDSAIRTATLPELKACEAYMLFYELVGQMEPTADEADDSGDSCVAAACDAVPDASVVQATINADQSEVEPEPGGATPTSKDDAEAAAEVGREKPQQQQQQQQQQKDSEEGNNTSAAIERHEGQKEIVTSSEEGKGERSEATSSAKDGEEEEGAGG